SSPLTEPAPAPTLPAPILPPTLPSEAPIVPRKRREASFANVGNDPLEKAPFSWEFRTALIGMVCSLPAFLFIALLGNYNVFGFSFPLMMIGLFTGLAFRFTSHPWALPMMSLMSAIFTMFIAELVIVIGLGAAWAEMNPFLYAVTMMTLNPLDLFMDTMTHALGGARGYVVGAIAAFWLACND
ncbi:MAG: hypothetical protein O3A92_15430, partial [Verrucomicrobia bacterium]|nr:hypothetical protein [Verrucomicrobiota bacterium]